MEITHAIGRRKTSVARVYLKSGKGKIVVNNKDYKEYFSTMLLQSKIEQSQNTVSTSKSFDIKVNVFGGGLTGQVGAMVHGISKALLLFDSNLKPTLKKEKLTTRDSRAVERKKYGHRKARRSFQFSKR